MADTIINDPNVNNDPNWVDGQPPRTRPAPEPARLDIPGTAPIAPVPAECPKHLGRLLDEVLERKTCNMGVEHSVLVGRRCAIDGDSYDLNGVLTERVVEPRVSGAPLGTLPVAERPPLSPSPRVVRDEPLPVVDGDGEPLSPAPKTFTSTSKKGK